MNGKLRLTNPRHRNEVYRPERPLPAGNINQIIITHIDVTKNPTPFPSPDASREQTAATHMHVPTHKWALSRTSAKRPPSSLTYSGKPT
jgi:hypothetical protein